MLFPQNELLHVFELSANIWTATRTRLEARLRPLSMTWPQFGVLLGLDENDGVTQRELGELLEIDRTTTSVICDSLEKRGWAQRRSDAADRRVRRVYLTTDGRASLAEAQRIVWSAYAPLAAVLSSDDVEAVVPKLQRLYEAVKEIPHEDLAAEGGR